LLSADIVNMNGKIVKKQVISNNHNNININELRPGLYIVNLKTGNGFVNKKIVKH